MSALAPGLCSVTFRTLPVTDVLALAHDAGIEGIEWGADVHAPPGDWARARSIATMSRAHGIAVASYGSYVEAGAAEPDAFAFVLETAVALGAPNIRVWAGRRGVPSTDVSPAERERCIDDLRAFADAAVGAGVTVSLEFHRETLTDSLASTLDLFIRADRANLFSYWQPRPGIPRGDAADELLALRPFLAHLHVFSWNERRERFPLADGAPFWQPLLDAVATWRDARFQHRWAMLEFVRGDDPAAFAADARELRVWLNTVSAEGVAP